jgi:DNA-binding NtrC family response regulator
VQSATRLSEPAAPELAGRTPSPGKKAKLSLLLITGDDMLWPQMAGAHLSSELVLKQVDSIEELLTATPAGQPAIVLWDARGETAAAAAALSRLQLHSPCFAVIALDYPGGAAAWTSLIAHRQVIAHVAVPVLADELKAAIENAREEVNVRTALLGDGTARGASMPAAPSSQGYSSPPSAHSC